MTANGTVEILSHGRGFIRATQDERQNLIHAPALGESIITVTKESQSITFGLFPTKTLVLVFNDGAECQRKFRFDLSYTSSDPSVDIDNDANLATFNAGGTVQNNRNSGE